MNVYRYPPNTLIGDYLRAAAGLGVGLGVLVYVPTGLAVTAVFGSVAALFGAFGARTLHRQVTKVAVTDEEVARAAFGTRVLPWRDLEKVKLRYYGTRRQQRGAGGFMQLTLKGAGTNLVFESNLQGFDYIVWRTARAVRQNRISLDPTSAGNMLALGVDADADTPPPGDGRRSPDPPSEALGSE